MYEMSRVDWRWAAVKGFYDRTARHWIAETGGYEAYAKQRLSKRRRRPDAAEELGGESWTTVAQVERPLAFATHFVAFEQVLLRASSSLLNELTAE